MLINYSKMSTSQELQRQIAKYSFTLNTYYVLKCYFIGQYLLPSV